MSTCPTGLLSFEQVQKVMDVNGVLLAEKITLPEQILKIKQYIAELPTMLGAPFRENVDMLALFSYRSTSFVVDFYNSCSMYIYKLDVDQTINLLKLLGSS